MLFNLEGQEIPRIRINDLEYEIYKTENFHGIFYCLSL